jgi:hypothetical protein
VVGRSLHRYHHVGTPGCGAATTKGLTHGHISAARQCLDAGPAWPADGASHRLVLSASTTHIRHSLRAMFLGQMTTFGSKELQKVRAPNEHRFFAWLTF